MRDSFLYKLSTAAWRSMSCHPVNDNRRKFPLVSCENSKHYCSNKEFILCRREVLTQFIKGGTSKIQFQMEILNKPTVHMKNREYVEEVVSQLIKGGASKLQVISDFDRTISRKHLNGKNCTSSYGVLEQSPMLKEEYRLQTAVLYDHYHPIEVDPSLTKEEKLPLMIEWFSKCLNLMLKSGVTKGCIPEMVSSSNICLRDGCDQLLKTLYEHDVPLLIFSAGLGDVLKEVLQHQNLLFSNIKIIANFITFDDKDNIVGFEGDMIHTYNKNIGSIGGREYFDRLQYRNNIILMGDSLGDVNMAEGVKNVDAILKIGYLNTQIEKSLPEFLDSYDIVLADDQTMEVVSGLLQNIL